MLLPRRHHFCIWCGAALWDDAASEEHVIPDCLGGRLRSPDVCRECNSTFGAESDWRLVHDESIYRAAMEAGVPHDEFMPRYEVTTKTGTGLHVKLRVRNGVSRPAAGLAGPELYVGADQSGNFSPQELQNFRGRLKAKTRAKLPHLPSALVDAEVEKLFTDLQANKGTRPVYSAVIGEGLAPTLTDATVGMTITFHPVDTMRAIAKSLFTIGKNVVPRRLERAVAESLAEIAKFAQSRPDAQPVVHSERRAGTASRAHSLAVRVQGSVFSVEAVLFGVQRWWVESTILCNGSPARLPQFLWESVDDPTHGPVRVREEFTP